MLWPSLGECFQPNPGIKAINRLVKIIDFPTARVYITSQCRSFREFFPFPYLRISNAIIANIAINQISRQHFPNASSDIQRAGSVHPKLSSRPTTAKICVFSPKYRGARVVPQELAHSRYRSNFYLCVFTTATTDGRPCLIYL